MRHVTPSLNSSKLAIASAALATASVMTAASSFAADWVLPIPGTGNPYASPAPTFASREAENLVWPVDQEACSSRVNCTAAVQNTTISYDASFWPIILFGGAKQLTSPTWNASVQSGVDDLGGYNKTAEEQLKYPGPGLAQLYEADPTGHFDIVGYSQGATVAAYFKNNYAAESAAARLPALSQLTFILAADPNRPNGGIFMRPGIFGPFNIPILDATVGIPAKTDTGIKTTDIAIQYDGVSDFPEYPINVLADANALAGLFFIHPTYVDPHQQLANGAPDPSDTSHPYGYSVTDFQNDITAAENNCTAANNCMTQGDTTYITLPTQDLPLLAPLRYLGSQLGLSAVATPALDLIQPLLKVMIETGYNRSDYGTPTPFQIVVPLNPAKVVTLPTDLAGAAVQGVQDAINDLGGHGQQHLLQDPFADAASMFTDPGPALPLPAPLVAPKPVNTNTPHPLVAQTTVKTVSLNTGSTVAGTGSTTTGTTSTAGSSTTTGGATTTSGTTTGATSTTSGTTASGSTTGGTTGTTTGGKTTTGTKKTTGTK